MVSHTTSYIVFILIIGSNRASAAEDDGKKAYFGFI